MDFSELTVKEKSVLVFDFLSKNPEFIQFVESQLSFLQVDDYVVDRRDPRRLMKIRKMGLHAAYCESLFFCSKSITELEFKNCQFHERDYYRGFYEEMADDEYNDVISEVDLEKLEKVEKLYRFTVRKPLLS